MAGTKALNVRMNFQVDTTQARQQIQQLGAQLNSIMKASNFNANTSLGITQEILSATKAAAQLKTAIAEAINPLTGNLNLSAFNDQLIASGMKLSDYRTQLSALGTAGNQAFNALTRSIMTAETPLLRTGKAAQQMWTVLGNTVRWQATSSLLHGIMSTASQAMGYVKSLDNSLNNIRIVTGQSQAQMERFAKTANQAAKQLNTSTNEYAKASLIYYQQGLSNKEVEARTATTIKLANVAGESAAKVSDQLTAVWNNFYDGSKSLEYYADVMTALGASTASSTDEIAKGLEKFSSIAKTTGLSYEYATSALSTVVAATRQSADSVGTSFKTLFSRLQGLSLGETLDDGTTLNKYSKALDVIGVNIKNANGSLKDMDRILDEIGDKWTSLSKAEQVALAQTVGGARNYTGLVSLMDNWDSFQVNLKTAQQAQGTLQNQADIYAQSWEAASKHVKAASETIYKNLLDDKFFKGMTNMFGYFLDGIGEVTNQMGGFKGVMSGLANFAFTTFAPQISKSFANIGSSIYGITPWGQEKVLDLRRQAMNAVTSNVRLSRYDSVDQLAHSYNKSFVDRQIAYDNAVAQGRISEYQQPVYQQLFTSIGQQEDATIQAAEQVASNKNLYDTQYGQTMTAVQAAINARYDRLRKEFDNISPEQLAKITSTQAGAARYQAYENWKNGDLLTAKQLEFDINTYAKARGLETQTADLRSYYAKKNGNYSLSSTEDMRIVANRLYGLSEAAKTSKQPLDDVIVGLGAFDKTLGGFGKNISELTDSELKQLFDGTLIDQTLALQARNFDAKTVGSEMIKAKIENSIRDVLGLQPGEKSDVVSETFKALTTKGLSREEQAKLLSQIGIDKEKQLAMLGNIEEQTAPKTIAMSSALATNMGALASLGQVITSVSTAVKTFGDENATAGQQVASLTSLAMAGSMAIKPFGNFVKTAKDQVTIFGNTLGMTNGTLGLIMAGIAAVGITASAVAKDLHKTSLTGAIENYNTALATSAQLASEAKASYEQLMTSSKTHSNLLNNLSGLRKGTQEYTLALLEANEAATNIIESQELIYGQDYLYNKEGIIEFTAGSLEEAQEKARQEMITTATGNQQISFTRQILANSADNREAVEEEGYARSYTDQLLEVMNPDGTQSNVSLRQLITYLSNKQQAFGNYETDEETGKLVWKFNSKDQSYEDWLKNEFFWASSEGQTLTEQGKETFWQLLGANDENSGIEQLKELLDIVNLSEIENEEINAFLQNNYVSKRELKYNAAVEGLVGATISGLTETIANQDLVSTIISSSLLQNGQATTLLTGINREAIDNKIGQGTMKPRDWYEKLYEKSAADLTDEEVYAKVSEGLINEFLLYGLSSEKLKGAESLFADIEDFKGVFEVAQQLENLHLPQLEGLTYQQITSEFNKLLDIDTRYGSLSPLDTDKNKAIQQYRDYAKQLYNNQLNDFSTALLRGLGDGALDGITEYGKGTEFQKIVATLTGRTIYDSEEVMASLTYGSLKTATNAIISANEIGTPMAQTMYHLLLEGKTSAGVFTQDTLDVIKGYNYGNDLQSIAANNMLKKIAVNQSQRDKYVQLFTAQIEAIEKEKGWFNALYTSSGFSDVIEKISEQFQSSGKITAQYITELAGKSEELSQFLKVSADNSELLGVNAGGIAAIFTALNKGTTGLTADNMSSEFIRAVSTASSNESVTAQGFDIVDNLNLSRASSELMDYFQEAGKAWYGIKQSGQGFYSERMQDLIRLFGNEETQRVYQEAGSHTDWNFQQMWDYMEKNDTSGFMSSMEVYAGVKKGKAKGGGGPEDVWSSIYDLFGINNMSSEEQADFFQRMGLEITKNGEVYLNANGEETPEDIIENLIREAVEIHGMDEEAARDLFGVSVAQLVNSGQTGPELAKRAIDQGVSILGSKGTPVSEAELKAYFDLYGVKSGKYKADEYEEFKADFIGQGGNLGVSLNSEQWSKITSLSDLASMANQAGVKVNLGSGQKTIESTAELAKAYGAFDQETGKYDYNKLLEMIVAQNGTEEDLIRILEQDVDISKDSLVAKTTDGHEIQRKENESVKDFVQRIYESQGNFQFGYENLSAQGAEQVYIMQQMDLVQDEDGTFHWQWRQEQPELTDSQKTNRLKNEFGWSQIDIDKARGQGQNLDDMITQASTEREQQLQKEARQRAADMLGLSSEEYQVRADLMEQGVTSEEATAFAISGYDKGYAEWIKAGRPTAEQLRTQAAEVLSSNEQGTSGTKKENEALETYKTTNKIVEEHEGIPKSPYTGEDLNLNMPNSYFQAEQDFINQLYTNYQQQLQAQNDLLAKNSEFITNPENARLAAWTAAARENPELLGALYQNALKEGYTGDQFTAMYDYQGLQAEVQQSYQRYATAAWNGRNVTAQQRFDFLNQAYEKASMEGIDKLSPFEKQILTLVGEIDDSTGQLVEYGEENTTDAATRAKKNGQINEEGQLVDEEGNVIKLPQNQQPQSTGGNISGQGDITAGGQTQGKEKTTIFSNGMVRNNTTGQYAMPDGSGGWTVVDSPDKIDWDGSQAQAKSQSQIPGMDGRSSGQNNARLLAYASGKEGHIAVTGELGPELRVKSDGSMDILGKTGREYAWVEPDDRIYTAAQSAGILKSNKIPGLEGLAKGINNFIPGYAGDFVRGVGAEWNRNSGSGSGSSSGGGSRGGGAPGEKDPRYDPNTLKIRDILERYYTILQQVDDITKAVEHIGKAIDRGWGEERIKNLERQEQLLESQYKMQETYVKEIKDYLQVDKDALTTMVTDFVKEYNEGKNDTDKINLAGATFDENGVLTNYKDIVDKLVSTYNKNAEANAQNKEEQYKFQERLKDIQMYTDTLNQLQEEEEKLYDLNNQILSTKIRQITYRIEYENELDANDLRLINYQYEKIGDNVFRDAELIDLLSQKATIGMGQVKRYGEGIFDIIGKYQDRVLTEAQKKQFFENPLAFAKEWQSMIASNPRFQDITDEDKTQLENYMDQMVTQMQGVEKYYNEAIKKIGDDIKTFGKMLDSTMDKFDYFDAVYKSMKNIADLTNRSLTKIDSQFMNTLSNASLNNSINKLAGARRILDTMRQAEKQTREKYEKELASGNQDAIDNMKKELDEVIKQHQEASKNVLSYWEDCLQKIQDTYKNTVEEAKRDFERMISPFYLTLEDLQNQYDREKKLGELYVKDYQRIHDLSKLNRDIQKSIDDTDNLKGKQNLRDLQEEILGLQEDGTELSEYDLNILEKRYNLELARQALEDARNAKSMVRLSRDNNGNWSYVYTSNQDDIDEAKQKYEDAIADMEKANEDYINDLQDQLTSLMREAEDELANLDLTGLTPEQITKKVEDTLKPYYTMWSFLSSQLQNAFGNNELVLPYSQQMFAQQPNLTTAYGDTLFAKLTGNNDLSSFSNNFLNNLDWLGSKYIEAGITAYSEQQSRVYEIAKPVIEGSADIANMTEDLGNIISNSSDESDAWVAVVEQEATRAEGAFSDMLKALGEFQGKLGEVTDTAEEFQNILKSLNEFIKEAGNSIQPDDDPGHRHKDVAGYSSGGYTGRWQYADTGMYTGEWPDGSSRRNGRLAWLHQKELVLNAHDTENFLDAMQIVRQLDNLTNWMANGLGDLMMPRVSSTEGELNQNVHIEAEFPNVTDHNEIEQALGNLVNMASQYANRK